MSTATEISRLSAARDTIRDKLISFGLATSTDKLDVLASEIDDIVNRGAVQATVQEGDTYTIPAGYHNGSGTVTGVSGGGNYTLQSKEVTPTKNQISVTPDSGYYGLSSVTVGAIPEAYQNVSSVTATASDVLSPKVIVDATGAAITGSMPNNGAVTRTLDATTGNQSYTIPAGYHNGSGSVSIVLETKSVTPTKSTQNITPTSGKVLSKVTVAAIPADYQDVTSVTATAGTVLDGYVIIDSTGAEITGTIPTKTSTDLTVSGATVTVPSGYYATSVSKSVATGTLSASATGSATVSSLSYTYDTTDDEFDITGSSAITGTATASVTTPGYISTGTTGSTSGTASVAATVPKIVGAISLSGTAKVTPTISRTNTTATGATNVGSGAASTSAPSSGYFVSVQSAAAANTITASTSITTSGYGTDDYNGIAGDSVSVGANASSITYITVPGGSATTPATTITVDPTVTINSSTGLVTASYSGSENIIPTVSAGYITNGTAGIVSTSGSKTLQLTTLGATTYYTSSSDQTISAGRYLTGAQTIKAVTTSGISAANIKDGITIKVGDSSDDDRVLAVTGTFTDASTVSSGQTAAAATQILTGYSAWVDALEVKGSMTNNGAVSKVLDATTSNQTYTVPAGYHNGSGTISIVLETKTATPTTATQNITPTSGKVLSKVTINPIPAQYGDTTGDDGVAANVLSGVKVHSNLNGSAVAITGSMTNNGAISGSINGLTTTSYSIPAGYTSGGSVSLTSDIEDALSAI